MIDAATTTTSSTSTLVVIDEQSQVGGARRSAAALASKHGLASEAAGRLAIIVTEAATNILRHAGHGVIVLRALVAGDTPGMEVLALDKGPGIPDVARALSDGYSTAGTAGQGLGGMQRLADVFEMFSQRGVGGGTALLARVGGRPIPMARAVGRRGSLDERLGVVCIPMRGETECGDAWRVIVDRERVAIMLVDGLGHGPDAAIAAAIASESFSQTAHGTPEAALSAADSAMRGSRGAALSLVAIDEASRSARFAGVGNVDGRVLSVDESTHLVPQSGIVGHTMPAVRPTDAPWPVGARLVMHSDGVSARWRMSAYGKLFTAHPALLAGVLYRDFGRARDDATVIVFRDDAVAEKPDDLLSST